jgi:hypothetical protein
MASLLGAIAAAGVTKQKTPFLLKPKIIELLTRKVEYLVAITSTFQKRRSPSPSAQVSLSGKLQRTRIFRVQTNKPAMAPLHQRHF